MTDAREIALGKMPDFVRDSILGGSDFHAPVLTAMLEAMAEYADYMRQPLIENEELLIAALAAKDAENAKQAAEIERLKKSAADDTLLFIAHNKQMNELKDQIEQLQATCDEYHKRMINAKQEITSTALAVVEAERDDMELQYKNAKKQIEQLQARLVEREHSLSVIQSQVNVQAEDEGLWFVAETATEEYLQAALRLLHSVIENNLPIINK